MRLSWRKTTEPEKVMPTLGSGANLRGQTTQQSTDSAIVVTSAAVTAEAPVTADVKAWPEKTETLERMASKTSTLSGDEAGEDDESKYMHGPKLWLLTFGLFLATFVVALDNTIIAVAIPKITTVFNSLDDVGWYGSAYLLTTTSLQPTFGKIYTFFNVKYTYVVALLLFELGSVLCGAAVNSTMLIVGRAVAGIGAAALFSGGMTIVAYSVPLRQRPIYIGILSSTFGIASVIGPLLGGVFTDQVTWRWCFYINLPFGGLAIAAVFFFFHNPEREESKLTFKQKLLQIDMLGALFLICAIICLLLALQWGGSVYPWSNSRVWGCLLGFALIISVFIGIQIHRGDLATLPPRIIIKQRTVLACALVSAFLAMGLYTHLYYLPFYFQAVQGTSAEGSGIRTIAYLVSMTVASIMVGGAVTSVGYYVPFTWVGTAMFTIGAGLIYTLRVDTISPKWIGYQILTGFGMGMSVQIPFIAVQVVLNKKDMPIGNATPIFFNSLGGSIAISVAQNIFSNKLMTEIPIYAPGVNPAVVIQAGATYIRSVVTPAQLPGVLEAYDVALTSAYIFAIGSGCVAFLCSFLFEWKSVKGQKVGMGGA